MNFLQYPKFLPHLVVFSRLRGDRYQLTNKEPAALLHGNYANFVLYSASGSVMAEEALKTLRNVDIDNGRFKYILIKVYDPNNEGKSKFIIRGNASCPYHADIYDQVSPMITRLGLESECVGGGRIEHSPDAKTIHVYGYSQGYGPADHSISCELLKEHYPNYSKIYFSNEGY